LLSIIEKMRKKTRSGSNFFSAVIINLVFNLEWTIPAWILLALHFWLKISIWWFVGAIALWIIFVMIKTIVFSWLVRVGNIPDKPKENKNPYSSSGYKPSK